ncbi:hypothetical protein [Polyangium mundeleinium]|uniref:Tail assembly chaperone n=1 Tax=Polyangium mundeleinium TaxID=2995306 RepID=A0ABT5F4F4_9BACT|nr:hypothetical protein [Polyangium mundeleinium]MDC0748970.1 hypothetical protein [Polyangium mundeleinium]
MSNGPKAIYNGPSVCDITDIKDDIIDLPDGEKQHLKFEKDGFEEVLDELLKAKSGALAKAGIAIDVVARIEGRTGRLKVVREKKGIAKKMYEVLDETEAHEEHLREGDIAIVAKTVQTAAKHVDPSVAAPFEKTLKYYSQIGEKAAATRRKNAKAAAEAAAAEKASDGST